jgi:hypothetical protein
MPPPKSDCCSASSQAAFCEGGMTSGDSSSVAKWRPYSAAPGSATGLGPHQRRRPPEAPKVPDVDADTMLGLGLDPTGFTAHDVSRGSMIIIASTASYGPREPKRPWTLSNESPGRVPVEHSDNAESPDRVGGTPVTSRSPLQRGEPRSRFDRSIGPPAESTSWSVSPPSKGSRTSANHLSTEGRCWY